jgi:hypothetical protein
MTEYKKFLDEAGKNFKLTALDLHNLTDLFFMVTPQIDETLKMNKMDKWFLQFSHRLQSVTLANNKEEYQEELNKLKQNDKKKNIRR